MPEELIPYPMPDVPGARNVLPVSPGIARRPSRELGEPFPLSIVVFCDRCGTEVEHDYLVHDGMTCDERLGIARAHLIANEGWTCTVSGDFCPACALPFTSLLHDPGPAGYREHNETCCMNGVRPSAGPHPDCIGVPAPVATPDGTEK